MSPTHSIAPQPPTTRIRAHAIEPARLDRIRARGMDDEGNSLAPFPATGSGEPLRCCLRYAREAESIMLVSYAPFTHQSVWREVGPVYVHAERCPGYSASDVFPSEFRRGPFVLRTYGADLAMAYDHLALVPEGDDVESAVRDLLADRRITQVHVRPVLSQCFLFAVSRDWPGQVD